MLKYKYSESKCKFPDWMKNSRIWVDIWLVLMVNIRSSSCFDSKWSSDVLNVVKCMMNEVRTWSLEELNQFKYLTVCRVRLFWDETLRWLFQSKYHNQEEDWIPDMEAKDQSKFLNMNTCKYLPFFFLSVSKEHILLQFRQ